MGMKAYGYAAPTADPPALKAAIWALAHNLWPVAIHPIDSKTATSPGKQPIGEQWGKERHDEPWFRATFKRYPKAGVGLKLGIEGGVIDIEVDDPVAAAPALARMFPDGIPPTMGWDSAKGPHHLFRWDDRLARYGASVIKAHVAKNGEITRYAEYHGLEIRIGATSAEAKKQLQSVIPPSLMANGQARRWNGNREILPLPESVFADLDRYALDKPAAGPEKPAKKGLILTAMSSTEAYSRSALEKELATLGAACEGIRNDQLNVSSFNLGQFVGAGTLNRSEVEAALIETARGLGLGEREIMATVRSGLDAGIAQPRDLSGIGAPKPSANGNGRHHHNGTTNGKPSTNGDGHLDYGLLSDEALGIIPADSVEPEAVEWEWENRIARGKFSLLAGEGGDGKTQVALAIVAAITTGGMYPDGSGPAKKGHCFIVAAEDGLRDTLRPRLEAIGADCSRVTFLKPQVTTRAKDGTPVIHPMSFQDLSYWSAVFKRRPDACLLVADPIPAYLGRGVNDHRNAEVRQVLEPFIGLLEELRIALLGLTHLGKSADLKTPTHKILGSVAYANLARTVHITIRDPQEKGRRFLCQIKNNLGPEQASLAYRIAGQEIFRGESVIRTSRTEFESGTVDVDPRELMAENRGPTKKRGPEPQKALAVAEWLFDYLADRQPTPLAAVFDAAGEAGHLGEKKGGKWSNIGVIYRASEKIAELAPPRDGGRIATFKAPSPRGNREITYWQLVSETESPWVVEAVTGETDWGDSPAF